MSEYAVMPLNDYQEACEAVREMTGTSEKITSDHLAETIRAIPTVPLGAHIKYIIPATYMPPRTSDGLGFDAITFTFTRENTNQLFYVQWRLQDAGDNTTPGYWVSSIIWELTQTGNYQSKHCAYSTIQGSGKSGNLSARSYVQNYSKNALTEAISFIEDKGSGASYARLGQLYKGLIIITDSTYTGKPMLDETKLWQYFSNNEHLSAGW